MRFGLSVILAAEICFQPGHVNSIYAADSALPAFGDVPRITSGRKRKPSDAPEIAFLGRSNVGKSSLINKLCSAPSRPTLLPPPAVPAPSTFLRSMTASLTRLAVLSMIFADLPGYGYAKISKSISSEWPLFIEPYLAERPVACPGHLPGRHQHPPAGLGHDSHPLLPGSRQTIPRGWPRSQTASRKTSWRRMWQP